MAGEIYTNPGALDTRAQTIKQSADTRNALIANIGVQSANIINSARKRQIKKLQLDNEAENKRQLSLIKQRDKVTENYTRSGLGSDSFFNIGYENIDNIALYTGNLEAATSKEERQKAAKNLEMAYSNQAKINQFVGAYKGWFDGYSKEMSQSKRNKSGSIYTGGFKDPNKSTEWDDFSKQTFDNYNLKNALIGSGVDENNNVLPPAEFYQAEDGAIMAKVEGYEDFDVMSVIMQEPVIIQDVNKPLRDIWEKNKYEDPVTKKINPKYLDRQNVEPVTKINKHGVAITTETYQINPEIQQAWLKDVDVFAEKYMSSIIDEGSFRNANATFMSIAGTLDTDNDGLIKKDEALFSEAFKQTLTDKELEAGVKIQPLKAINGFYELDNKSKAMFKEVLLNNGYNEFIGPTGTITEIVKIDKNYKKPTDNKTSPERVTSVVNDFEKAIINDDVSFLKILDDKFKNVESDGVNLNFYIDKYEEKDANKVKSIKLTDKKAMGKLATDYFKKLYQSETSLKERNINLPKIRREIDRIINEKLEKATSERFPGTNKKPSYLDNEIN